MKLLRYFEFKNLINYIKTEKLSMRRRFVLYIITVIAMFLALLLLLLNLFGVLNPTDRELSDVLETQLATYSEKIENDIDKTAAYAISFSEQLEADIQKYLLQNNLTFDDLKDNPDAIDKLQGELYNTVYLNMQMAPSSGAFYILNTTVNSKSETPLCSGIYLKYVNLYSENTANKQFTLYRGTLATGKNNDLLFHSGWQNECKTDFFEKSDSLFSKNTRYVLSSVKEIPETWESARYVFVPICDIKKNIIGVCGFEINNLYFQLAQKPTDNSLGHVVYGLLNTENDKLSGQFTSNSHYVSDFEDASLKVYEKNNFSIFNFGTYTCIGKTKKIRLGSNVFDASVMITQAQYNKYIQEGRRNIALILLVITVSAIAACMFLSKKYVSPILRKIEQIKTSQNFGDDQTKIKEIDDLFAFLREKDNQYEAQLEVLEESKHVAEEEATKAKAAYERALKEYELVKCEIEQLSEKRENNIVLEEYEYFLCNLSTLTASEYRIYELYLQGKNGKQIAEIVGIKENTLKFHNKNIYSKLGISSRKQLLKFAALKQQQDRKGEINQ